MTRKEYHYWLANIPNIGIRKINLLLQVFGSAEAVYQAGREELSVFKEECCPHTLRFSDADLERLVSSRDEKKIHESMVELQRRGIYFVSREEEDYPKQLLNIYDAPFALYVKGALPRKDEKLLAIVGARECTGYGKEMAKYLAGAIAKEGITIVSGLARGIDAYAHEGALAKDGVSYGVLGCGIDICYPKENINLYMELQKRGGVMSEYAPGITPIAGNFPMRNRIISGLCDGILVIEAREKSGSLITVDMGLEQGKNIYAVPGRVTDSLSSGCNNLIKLGAKPVTSPMDILEDYFDNYKPSSPQKKEVIFENNQQKIIWNALSLIPKHIEELAMETEQPLDELSELLLTMELKGQIRQSMKNYYVIMDHNILG